MAHNWKDDNRQSQAQAQQQAAAAQAPMIVVQATAIQRMMAEKAKVSAEDLTSLKFRREDMLELPIIAGKFVTRIYAKAGARERQMNIGDVNTELEYAYLTPDSLLKNPAYMNGWFPVKKGENAGAKNIPEHYFDAEGYVVRGDSVLCFTTKEYVKEMQEADLKVARARLAAYQGPIHMERQTGGAENAAVTQALTVAGEIQH